MKWIPASLTPEVWGDDPGQSEPVLATDGHTYQVCRLTREYDLGDGEPLAHRWVVVGRDGYTFEGVTHWMEFPALI